METVLDASARLRAAGYTTDLSAVPHGRLRCAACGATVDAASCTVVDVVRFEGGAPRPLRSATQEDHRREHHRD